jgi:hypothetical protein
MSKTSPSMHAATRPPSPVRFSTDPHDPPYWPIGLMAIEKIHLLADVSPAQFQAIHVLVDAALREKWRRLAHAEILRALDQEDTVGRPYQWKRDAETGGAR